MERQELFGLNVNSNYVIIVLSPSVCDISFPSALFKYFEESLVLSKYADDYG